MPGEKMQKIVQESRQWQNSCPRRALFFSVAAVTPRKDFLFSLALIYNTLDQKLIMSSYKRKRAIDLSSSGGELDEDNNTNDGGTLKVQRSDNDNTINPWTGEKYSPKYYSILETRTKLPVYQFKDELIEAVQNNQFVVVEGETGSGTC